MANMRRRIHAVANMRRRIHEEEDTCK